MTHGDPDVSRHHLVLGDFNVLSNTARQLVFDTDNELGLPPVVLNVEVLDC